ncbi:hypothetical protein HD806DRAFT_552086 [Xylariaceae sp. AK1471]|nr:hypothetical protein HD806DRAFT_552086 [Xylariaceae sp. AK1471]
MLHYKFLGVSRFTVVCCALLLLACILHPLDICSHRPCSLAFPFSFSQHIQHPYTYAHAHESIAMTQPSSSKRKMAEQMAPGEKTAPSSASAHVSSDLVAPSTTGSSDSPKTTTDQHQGDTAITPVESIPLDKLETAPHTSKAHHLLAETEEEKMPTLGSIESQHLPFLLTNTHEKLCRNIFVLASQGFKPTPWDKLKPDDQSKLNRWTPDARLLIESERGYQFIFQAWIWHILDDEVFSADPTTKWQDQGDGFEAVRLLSQFIDCILRPKDADDDNNETRLSMKDHPMWHRAEYNKWRSVSAELALKKSPGRLSIDKHYVMKRVDSNLGYLMKSFEGGGNVLRNIGLMAADYDTAMLITRLKPMLVWTDPLKQNEQTASYGFPFITKDDPERERLGAADGNGKWQQIRMVAKACAADSIDIVELQATSEGKPVQLVISPGVVTRGCERMTNHKLEGCDWHMIYWRYYMQVLVPGSFRPPLEPAIIT